MKKALITGITGQDGSYLTEFLRADSFMAKRELGWAPKVSFRELAKIMVDADLEAAGLSYPGEGRKIISERA